MRATRRQLIFSPCLREIATLTMRMIFALLLSVALTNFAYAEGSPGMRVIVINDHMLAFYDGRDPSGKRVFSAAWNWQDDGAMKLGVATYAIHSGDEAVVYDTFPSIEQAQWVRSYLERQGIKQFTVVLSHWHPDHIAGNAVYTDSPIIATTLGRETLARNKEKLEAGEAFGPPGIKPLVLPNIAYHDQLDLYLGELKLELHHLNIHSADGTVLYLSAEKTLLAGDTLEDSLTYMAEIGHLAEHIKNLKKLRTMEIEKIYPNHGDPNVIMKGGYSKTLIDATIDYITKILARAHEKDYLKGTMEEYIGDSVAKGWVHHFEPYREVHQENLKAVQAYYQDKPLPDLREK